MGLTDKLQKKKENLEEKVRTKVEDFNMLIRVYLQASFAANLGVMDFRMLPDLKLLKQKFKIPTQVRLGVAEKAYVANIMKTEYKLTDSFFSEIDSSIKRVCKKQQDMQSYFGLFQAISQELFTALASEMQWTLRLPGFFSGLIKSSTKSSIHKILTENDFKAMDVRKAAMNVRNLKEKLKFSEDWLFQFSYPVLMLSKGAKVK